MGCKAGQRIGWGGTNPPILCPLKTECLISQNLVSRRLDGPHPTRPQPYPTQPEALGGHRTGDLVQPYPRPSLPVSRPSRREDGIRSVMRSSVRSIE